MLSVLRFIGVFNAAIWVGSAIFFTFGVAPGVFSSEMERVFPREYTGYIGQVLIGRYFKFHLVCGLIAFGHFLAEVIYAGKPFRRLTFGLLTVVVLLGLAGSLVFAPRIRLLHAQKHRGPVAERAEAARQLGRIHGVSAVANLLSLVAIVIYTWQVTNPSDPMRFVGTGKFRS